LGILESEFVTGCTIIEAGRTEARELYKVMIGLIGPRPIGWISTISQSGIHNLAPFSFFNMLSMNPCLIGFCPSLKQDPSKKDSLRNVEETKCFVHNVVTSDLIIPMHQSSANYDFETNEFEKVGLTAALSRFVEAPRVAEAAVNIECKLMDIVSLGTKAGNTQLVVGEVLAIHINREGILDDKSHVNAPALALVGRLGRLNYCEQGRIFELPPAEV